LFEAAFLLDRGVGAHLAGETELASKCFGAADTKRVRDYIESMWGARALWPEQQHYLKKRAVEELPSETPEQRGLKVSTIMKREVVDRDGFLCRYCHLPVVPARVRQELSKLYPETVPWGLTNPSQHSAFQTLWLQFDHVVPLARGGANATENVVVSCAACNFMKWNYTLAEIGLEDPRDRVVVTSCWDGLTRLLGGPERCPL
jgi:hypothetical protein